MSYLLVVNALRKQLGLPPVRRAKLPPGVHTPRKPLNKATGPAITDRNVELLAEYPELRDIINNDTARPVGSADGADTTIKEPSADRRTTKEQVK